MVKVLPQNLTWEPRLELKGAVIPQSSLIKEFQKRHAHYLAKALEQPLLRLKDMAALRNVRQSDLFLSLKRDLALIKELITKLRVEEKERKSAKVGLKNAQEQAEDQRKKLHYTKIELAMAKQQATNLKMELEKAKEATRVAKEVTEASKQASYNLDVQETEVHLAKELAEVCRDYYQEVWLEALNLIGIPTASKWRKAKNIYYPPNIHEVPTALPPPVAPAPTSSKQPFGGSQPEDKGEGKEVKPLPKAKDPEAALKLKDATPKAKDIAPKAKEADSKSKETNPATVPFVSQPGNKEDPSPAKA
ncbi:uncharacterized protein LOC115954460 [Quercus lobata]|uniref:uncharacterized protein LOC115954460 n=1 Tax=Quercus lobata TaxID=97700 RepID=UPI0012443395|nr:uncharacterized protein LOC115954460 [Quercus lobata]